MTPPDEPDDSVALKQYRRAAPEKLELRPGEAVIDVGCGTGLMFALLHERVGAKGRIIGIDLSPEMLDQARDRVARPGWDNVSLAEAAVEKARIYTRGDAALFSFTHDVLQSPVAVANVVAHLKPGARVASAGAKLASRWNPLVNTS